MESRGRLSRRGLLRGGRFILKAAVVTAKYAKYPNGQSPGKYLRFTLWVNQFGFGNRFLLFLFAWFAWGFNPQRNQARCSKLIPRVFPGAMRNVPVAAGSPGG